MELLIFAVILAAVATSDLRKDLPFMVRGQTPPSHQERMARLARREARVARRHAARTARAARPRRRGPARAYAAGLWDHGWTNAANKRRIHWEIRDPAKAEAYRAKLTAKEDGTYRGPVRRGWSHARSVARSKLDRDAQQRGWPDHQTRAGWYQGVDEAAQAEAAEGIDVEPVRHPRYDATGERLRDPVTGEETPASDALRDELAARRNRGPDGDGFDPIDAARTYPGTAGRDAGEWQPLPTEYTANDEPSTTSTVEQEGSTMTSMTAPAGEAIGLEATEATLEQFLTNFREGAAQFEPFAASLEQQEVGPGVTGPIKQAAEAAQQVVTQLEAASSALQGSRNVGDAYSGAPDAGNKEFVTH